MTNQTSTALVKTDPRQIALRDHLYKYKSAFAAVLPKHLTADKVVKVVMAAAMKTPKLLECSLQSVVQAVMTSAQLGLEPGGPLGHAYLIPFKDQCQFMIGYRGMIDLARRSGQIADLKVRVVHTRDSFDLDYGLDEKLQHKPCLEGDPGPLRLVYGIAKLRSQDGQPGETHLEVMTASEIDKIRQRSQAVQSAARFGKQTPWDTDYEEMAKKTVIRRLFKYLPVSVEVRRADGQVEQMALAEAGEDEIPAVVTTAVEVPPESDAEQNAQPQPSVSEEPTHDPQTGEVTAQGYIDAIRQAKTRQDVLGAANVAAQRLTGEDRALASKVMQERLAQVGA